MQEAQRPPFAEAAFCILALRGADASVTGSAVFDGNSLIVGPGGEVLARASSFEEDLLVYDLNLDAVMKARLHAPLRRKESGDHAAHNVPTRRMSRGMIAALVMHVPDPAGGPPRAVESRFAFVFPAAGTGERDLAVPATGYAYPWSQAGRMVGLLVLEALHRESGDIVESERMNIQPAVRSDAGR